MNKGTQFFDIEHVNAEWVYTLDGSYVGKLEYENFNAASVPVKIVCNNIHPGTAKGIMLAALSLATGYHQMMPAAESPRRSLAMNDSITSIR